MAYTSNQELKILMVGVKTKTQGRVQAYRQYEKRRPELIARQMIELLEGDGEIMGDLFNSTPSIRLLRARVDKEYARQRKLQAKAAK